MAHVNFRVLLSASVVALAASGSALAQTDVEQTQQPDPAQEASRAAQPTNPADIIVTARRFEERLQDVPISITVFNQDQLDDRNVSTAADLAAYTPSLSANQRFGVDNTTFSIRGFFQELRTTASVAVYFADVVAPRGGGSTSGGDGAGPGSFFDVANVQVLKGPQGTLFGRNTTGGAILIVPQKPSADFEGYVEGTLGNHEERRLQGVVNVPISENIRARFGIDRRLREGYLRNISGVGPDHFANIDYVAARASLVVDLTPDLENYTVASYSDSDHNGAIPKVVICNAAAGGATSAARVLGTLACDQIARAQGRGRFVVENTQPDARQRLQQWQVINTTTWNISDSLTLKNIISYAQLESNSKNEAFGTNFIVPPVLLGRATAPFGITGSVLSFVPIRAAAGLNSNDQSTFTEELQLQGRSFGDRLTWQAGGYYESSKPDGFYGNQNPSSLSCTNVDTLQCTDVIGRFLDPVSTSVFEGNSGSLSRQLASTRFRNIGLYAQGTFDLTEQLKFTAGARYTWDKTTSLAQKQVFRFPATNDPRLYCLSPTVGPTGPVGTSFANAIPLSQIDTACLQRLQQKSDAPTWTLGLDYKPIEELLVYAKYSRGYRQGSTNAFGADGFEIFGPEKVDTYELGAKVDWRGSLPGFFNVAGYYNDFSDQQVQLGFASLTNAVAPNTGILNAGKSRIYGVEVEAGVRPFTGLSLQASYGYLNTKIQELDLPTFPDPNRPSLYDLLILTTQEGTPLPLSPKHKVSASVTYTLPLPESIGKVSIGGTYSYTSKQFASFQRIFGRLEEFDLVNLNLNWDSVNGTPIDLALFATNIFNEKYYYAVNDQFTSGFVSQFLAEPRMYGLRARVNFGPGLTW